MREEPQIDVPDPLQPERGRFNFALILAAAALLIILAALYFGPGRQSPPGAARQPQHFAFGPAEREYVSKLRFEKPRCQAKSSMEDNGRFVASR